MSFLEMNPLLTGAAAASTTSSVNDQREEFEDEEDISSRYHRVDSFDEAESASLKRPTIVAIPIIALPHNLDVLFSQLYEYYHARGYSPLVFGKAFSIVSIFVTLFIAALLSICFDWDALNKCFLDETACHTFSHYIYYRALYTSLALILTCVVLPLSIQLAIKAVAASKLRKFLLLGGITTRDLQTMHWSTVCCALRDLQQRLFFVKNGMRITALNLALRIMRVDNYKILVYSSRILPLGSPSFSQSVLPSHPTWYMGHLLEANLDFAFFKELVDGNTFEIKTRQTGSSQKQVVARLNRTLRILGLVNLVFLPLILLWTLIFFLFQYAEEFHSKRNYLGPRAVTPHARWLMREYNELPHQFERRMAQSSKHGERYLRPFANPLLVVFARGLTFISGSLVITLLLFGLIDDSVLLRVTLWDRNLVWFLALLTPLTAALRGLVPSSEEQDPLDNANILMRRVASYSHIYPDHWRGRANTYDVKEAFENLIPNRILLLARELLSVCVNWYILIQVLPRHTSELVDFCNDNTTQVDGVGDVCTESLLQLGANRGGDAKWEALLRGKPLGFTTESNARHHLIESKREKSYLLFKTSYSREICGLRDEIGDELLARIRALQRKEVSDKGQSAPEALEELMSNSLGVLDNFHLVMPEEEVVEEALLGGVGEDVIWSLEQWRDDEMKRRSTGSSSARRRVTTGV